jgi:acetyltransferase-like isoleucine patch superfamily enzyme
MDYFLDDSIDLQKIRSAILRNRSTDLMNDRERANFLNLPDGCRIRENAKILKPENFKCGNNVWIGEGAILDAQGGLEIGDYSQIGLYVMIWSHTSHFQALASQTAKSSKEIIYKATKIGKNCFIAGHSVIAPGVTLGNRVVILPNTFVDKDMPDNTVFGTNLELRNLFKKIELLEDEINKLKNK